jgi:hypothetical protein
MAANIVIPNFQLYVGNDFLFVAEVEKQIVAQGEIVLPVTIKESTKIAPTREEVIKRLKNHVRFS